MPDFARGPNGSANVNLPNTNTLGVPVSISDGTNVDAVDFSLTYNPQLLDITGVSAIPANWTTNFNIIVNSSTSDTINVTAEGNSFDLSSGMQNIVRLIANVPDNAPYDAATASRSATSRSRTTANPIATIGDIAVQKVLYFGDVNEDRAYSGGDATLISRVVVGTDSGFHDEPDVDPVIVADIDGSGTVDGIDASFVAQKASHLPRPEIPDLPATLPTLVGNGIDPAISTTTTSVAGPNSGPDTIPINISDLTGFAGLTMSVTYDPSEFSVSNSDIVLGHAFDSTPGWTVVANTTTTPGTIYLSFFGSTLPTSGSGDIADISFHALATATTSTSTIGLSGEQSDNGLAFTYANGSINVDSDGPAPGVGNFNFSPSTGQPMNVAFTFGDNVSASIKPSDLTLTNLTTNTTIPSSDFTVHTTAAPTPRSSHSTPRPSPAASCPTAITMRSSRRPTSPIRPTIR